MFALALAAELAGRPPERLTLPDYTVVARAPWGERSERSGDVTIVLHGVERGWAMSWACWTAARPGQPLPMRATGGSVDGRAVWEDCR